MAFRNGRRRAHVSVRERPYLYEHMFVTQITEAAATAATEERPLYELEREIGELAAHINAATCRWLGLVAEFDRRGGHERWGFASCSSWLAWSCSLDGRAAREQVRVARRLEELPRVREAFASGRLSYSKVRALARGADAQVEAELLELAEHATAAQLERIVAGYRRATAADPAQRAVERRHLNLRWDDEGCLSVRGVLPAEEGALLMRAIEIARTSLNEERKRSQDPTTPPPGSADALVTVAETVIGCGAGEAKGGDRHLVVVHVDAESIGADDDAVGAGELEDGAPLSGETVRRLACDAAVVSLVERGGRPVSVGRKTRSIPPSLDRALRSRDRCCRFPGCERTRHVDAHHIQHWARGGETSLSNLVRLCRHHHRLVHEGGFSVERRGERVVFLRPDGKAIPEAPQSPPGSMRSCVRAADVVIPPADGQPLAPRSRGEPMDLDLTVWGLADLQGRRLARSRPAEMAI